MAIRFSLLMLVCLSLATPAISAEVSGTINRIDTEDHTVTLSSGAEFLYTEDVSILEFESGDDVAVTYVIKSGEFIATKILPSSSEEHSTYQNIIGTILQIDNYDLTITLTNGAEFFAPPNIEIQKLQPGDFVSIVYEFTKNGIFVRNLEIKSLNQKNQNIHFTGTIFEIDADIHTIILNNGSEFIVDKSVSLSSLRVGDRVEITAKYINGEVIITNIVISESRV